MSLSENLKAAREKAAMREVEVTITEKLTMKVTVEAASQREAEQIVISFNTIAPKSIGVIERGMADAGLSPNILPLSTIIIGLRPLMIVPVGLIKNVSI